MFALLLACSPPADDTAVPSFDTVAVYEPGAVLRVMTWNVESVGEPGSVEFDAAAAIVRRLSPDVLGINEVNGSADAEALRHLAAMTDYPVVILPDDNPFGTQRNALLARVSGEGTVWTSAMLSGDEAASDLTRLPIAYDLGGLTVVVNHLKSGTDNASELRRTIDSIRTASIDAGSALVVMGDFNEELDSDDATPDVLTELPAGLPAGWVLGGDLAEALSAGIDNRVFGPLTGRSLSAVEATRLTGTLGTRPASGRRLDYVMVRGVSVLSAEVYHSEDEGLPGGIEKAGEHLAAETSLAAADHLPVVIELTL